METTKIGTTEFIDKCTARWLFEKTGVELYNEAIRKGPAALLAKLTEIRDQEKEHEEMLEDVIRRYGADPHHMTPSAMITKRESEGIVNVVKEEKFAGVIDALLAAELVDNANWELLIKLADKIGDTDAKKKFKKALNDEEDHLKFIRKNVVKDALEQMRH